MVSRHWRALSTTSKSIQSVQLAGFYPSAFPGSVVLDINWYLRKSPLEFVKWLFSGQVMSSVKAMKLVTSKVDMHDARQLEEEQGLSKAEFFNKYGFVLLASKVSLTAEDWLESTLDMEHPKETIEQITADYNSPTPAKMVYARELEPLVKQLVPTASKFFPQGRGVRRGPGGYKVFAANAHSDYPFDSFDEVVTTNPGLYDEQKEAFLSDPNAKGWMLFNFWRPVLPMQRPLGNQSQLCFADPNTIDAHDFVKVTLLGQMAGGQQYLNLKENPKTKWYYYPNMTTDEVLVFKQGHFQKGQVPGDMPVPHCGFSPGVVAKDAEPRCSFEFRLGFLYV